jgi:hypothetical protein
MGWFCSRVGPDPMTSILIGEDREAAQRLKWRLEWWVHKPPDARRVTAFAGRMAPQEP